MGNIAEKIAELRRKLAAADDVRLKHAALTGQDPATGDFIFHCGLGIRPPRFSHRQEPNAAALVAAWNFCREDLPAILDALDARTKAAETFERQYRQACQDHAAIKARITVLETLLLNCRRLLAMGDDVFDSELARIDAALSPAEAGSG